MTVRRNIKTFAPLLADDFVEFDEPNFDTDKYSDLLNNNANKLGEFKKYLICKLHDSWVINLNEELGKFRITLNDYSVYVFADSIIDMYKLPIDSDNISFPLILEFEGNLKVEYAKIDENGDLIQIGPTELNEYLYEQVTQIDNEKIEIVFHFWKSNLKYNKPGERVILIVSANEFNIIENQDEAWMQVFGNNYDALYKYFKEQFNSNRYVSDHNECEKLIDEFQLKTQGYE